ncbi:hypothetical protein INT43_004535 [Umbelopsis isabellina]|uniref:Uncharacterized protein n=1 Tax=Mortierella isabellina TaxID=91625 RepID=A0A8H7PFT7_MORIS|nr:hypothetical protein INT43_004535 [Umbelopsis isabellina]
MPFSKKTTVAPNTSAAAKPVPAQTKAQTKTTKTKPNNNKPTSNAAKSSKLPTYPAFNPQMTRISLQ